jgi:deazaflavin-dependent oxidoreductase (nitroreductase family)
MPNIRWLLALITRIHRFVYLKSGGRLGARLGGTPMLLLQHVGRKTGQLRATPLLYVEDGPRLVVVASNAGDDRTPAWCLNLRHEPEAAVRVGRERYSVRAREADPAERERLWPVLESSYSSYADYRERTKREIPIVILERSS